MHILLGQSRTSQGNSVLTHVMIKHPLRERESTSNLEEYIKKVYENLNEKIIYLLYQPIF